MEKLANETNKDFVVSEKDKETESDEKVEPNTVNNEDSNGDAYEESATRSKTILMTTKQKYVCFLKNLASVPIGKTILEVIDELEKQPSACKAYANAIDYPKKTVENRYWWLKLDGRPVM
eukprot:6061561-Ditylum_brightwellii.AAC.1